MALKLLWTERDSVGRAFQCQKGQIFPACGKHYIIVNWEIGWGALSKPKRQKKSCLPQTLILLWTEREAARGLSKSKRPKISCLRQTPYYCEQRDRLTSDGGRCPFKAKKAKKSCLPQTIILRDRLTEPFQSQKGKKNPASSRHLYYCELRDRLRGPSQSQKGKKNPACGRNLYYYELRERLRAPFQRQNVQKISACGRHLNHFELKEMCLCMHLLCVSF